MNVLIIEDEKPSARRLQRMLEKLNVPVDVMLHSVEESIEWFSNNRASRSNFSRYSTKRRSVVSKFLIR